MPLTRCLRGTVRNSRTRRLLNNSSNFRGTSRVQGRALTKLKLSSATWRNRTSKCLVAVVTPSLRPQSTSHGPFAHNRCKKNPPAKKSCVAYGRGKTSVVRCPRIPENLVLGFRGHEQQTNRSRTIPSLHYRDGYRGLTGHRFGDRPNTRVHGRGSEKAHRREEYDRWEGRLHRPREAAHRRADRRL